MNVFYTWEVTAPHLTICQTGPIATQQRLEHAIVQHLKIANAILWTEINQCVSLSVLVISIFRPEQILSILIAPAYHGFKCLPWITET